MMRQALWRSRDCLPGMGMKLLGIRGVATAKAPVEEFTFTVISIRIRPDGKGSIGTVLSIGAGIQGTSYRPSRK